MPVQRLLPLADNLLDLLAHGLETDPQGFQGLRRHAFTLVDEAQQDVLGADVVVIEHPGFFLSQDHNPPRSVGKPLEHIVCSALPASTGRPRGDWAEQPSHRRKPADNGYTISASDGR